MLFWNSSIWCRINDCVPKANEFASQCGNDVYGEVKIYLNFPGINSRIALPFLESSKQFSHYKSSPVNKKKTPKRIWTQRFFYMKTGLRYFYSNVPI